MTQCNPARTPVVTTHKLDTIGPLSLDQSHYHSLARAIQHLAFTRPNVAYVEQ